MDHWINTAFPLLERQTELDEPLPEGRYVTIEGNLDKRNNRIMHSVTWYADDADHHEIAKWLEKMPHWPLAALEEQRHPGGSSKEEERTVPEAIVCHVFKRKRRFTEGGIGQKLGWKTRRNDHGKLICRLVRKRLKLAGEIMRNHDIYAVVRMHSPPPTS